MIGIEYKYMPKYAVFIWLDDYQKMSIKEIESTQAMLKESDCPELEDKLCIMLGFED